MGKSNGSSIGKVFGLRNLKQLGVRLPARQLPLRLAELCRIDWSLYNHIEHGQFSDNPMLLTLLKALKIILDSVLLSGSHTIPIRRILVDFEFLCLYSRFSQCNLTLNCPGIVYLRLVISVYIVKNLRTLPLFLPSFETELWDFWGCDSCHVQWCLWSLCGNCFWVEPWLSQLCGVALVLLFCAPTWT